MGIKLSFSTLALFLGASMASGCALEVSRCVDIRELNFTWTGGHSSNIRKICFKDGVKYFRECKKKLSRRGTVDRILDEYFDEYLPQVLLENKVLLKNNSEDSLEKKLLFDKKLLKEVLGDDSNLSKFLYPGFFADKDSNLVKYLKGEIKSDSLGVPVDVSEKLNFDVDGLFLYAIRELSSRRSTIMQDEYGTYLISKQIASYRLAEYFGIGNLVVRSELVKLNTSFGEKVGVICDEASGVSAHDIKSKVGLKVDPTFQKHMSELLLLDTITGERDHKPDNCFFEVCDGKLCGVTAFDNECGFNLVDDLNLKDQKLIWGKSAPLVAESGKINLPHLSKAFAEKILHTDSICIRAVLDDVLSGDQIDLVVKRFNSLKEAIRKTIECNDKFLLEDNEWTKETMIEETSGKYGPTYFVYYLKKLGISDLG